MAKKIETAKIEASPERILSSKSGIVTIPGVKTERLTTLIIGTAPLICHKFSEKLRKQIRERFPDQDLFEKNMEPETRKP